MRFALPNSPCVLLLAGMVTACAGGEIAPVGGDDASVQTASFGLVRVSFDSTRTTDHRGASVDADAHFLAYTSLERDHLLYALNLWLPPTEMGCSVQEYPAQSGHEATISLLDAGVVGASGVAFDLALEPRRVPTYIPQFQGVVYGMDRSVQMNGPLLDESSPVGEVTIWADGGPEVGTFNVPLDAPSAVRIATINGSNIGSSIRWNVPGDFELGAETDAADVYVTIRRADTIGGAVVQCRMEQQEALRIASAELDETFGADVDLEVVVHTAHHAAIPVEAGIEGELLIESRDAIIVERSAN